MKIYSDEEKQYMIEELERNTLKIAESLGFAIVKDAGNTVDLVCPYHSAKSNNKGKHAKYHKDTNRVYCFHSNCVFGNTFEKKGATGIDLVAFNESLDTHGKEFWRVLERGFEILRLPLPEGNGKGISNEELKKIKKEEEIRKCINEFAKLCITYLRNLNQNHPAVQYLLSRGISPQTYINSLYGATHPTDKYWAKKHLMKLGFSEEIIREAGLLNKKGADFFFRRIMVFETKTDRMSEKFDLEKIDVIYFQGRTYENNNVRFLFPKNLKFDLFYKYQTLKNKEKIILTEGVFDADSINQIMGEEIAGSAFGTNGLSDLAIEKIAKNPRIKEIYFAFDYDENFAGQMGALKKGKLLIEKSVGKRIRFIILPKEKDPNDLLKEGYKKENFEKLIKEAVSIEEFEIILHCEKALANSNSKIAAQFDAIRNLENFLEKLDAQSPMFQKTLQKVAKILEVSYDSIFRTYEKVTGIISKKEIQRAVHIFYLKERKFPFIGGNPTKEKPAVIDLIKLVPNYIRAIPVDSHQYKVFNFNTGKMSYKISRNKLKVYCMDTKGNVITIPYNPYNDEFIDKENK